METVLKTQGLTKKFGNKAAVSGVNMTINRGDIYGFIGKNGAGKTTLIKMLVGLSTPTSGEIELFDSKKLNPGRRKIGTVIESPAFVPNMSAKDNLKMQWLLLGSKDKKIIDEALKMVGLEGTGRKAAKKFSLGMKQRLGIAMALMGEPEFLILDEPTNGLDPEAIIEMRKMLQRLCREKGLTILVSSHILGELSKLATRFGMINDGVLIDEFTAEEFTNRSQTGLQVVVPDASKAIEVLEKELGLEACKMLDQKTLEIPGTAHDSAKIVTALAQNSINIESIAAKTTDLEEYFMSKIGGDRDV